jgi:uncharacterized repeat protein (TIGR03803 family)
MGSGMTTHKNAENGRDTNSNFLLALKQPSVVAFLSSQTTDFGMRKEGMTLRILVCAALAALPVCAASAQAVLTTLHCFTNGMDGADPAAALVQGSDGNFYGTTLVGGMNGDGTIFKITTNGLLTSLYSFGTVTNSQGFPLDGETPYAGLVQGSDGNFYGTTTYGGFAYDESESEYAGYGTVFRLRLPPPPLQIALDGNEVSLAWAANHASGLLLRTTTNLTQPWVPVTNAPVVVGNQLLLTLAITNASQFFRLSQ